MILDRLKQELGERFPFIPDFLNNLIQRYSSDTTQFGESKFLDTLPEKGIYIEIGAYQPHLGSNSWHLVRKKRSWQGISVDPNPHVRWLWQLFRPSDVFINKAVVGAALSGDDKVWMNFFPRRYGGLNSIKSNSFGHITSKSKGQVGAISLEDLLQMSNSLFGKPDLIMIDVEGYDIELVRVLLSLDTEFQPNYLLLEDLDLSIAPLLRGSPYLLIEKLGPSSAYKKYL